jgi:hypothetical protein
VILDVSSADIQTYPRIDDDGCIATRKDGSERMLTSLVLVGDGESSFNGSTTQ